MQTALTQLQTKPSPEPLTKIEAEQYLESIETLASELNRAMEAIVSRQLSTFEDSLQRQKAVCNDLVEFPRRMTQRRTKDAAFDLTPVDAELEGRISAAITALLTLNQQYAALLKHSEETTRLFAGLFRSYTGTTQQATGMQTNMHTWSCEL